jgi:DNA-damage-inducible protein D
MTDAIDISRQSFEEIKHTLGDGKEYWYARDLMRALEYEEWRNFLDLIKRAIKAAKKSGISVKNHFVEVNNMVVVGSGAVREVEDFALSRLACYLVSMNGNPQIKRKIALAQSYFAIQTRRQEVYRSSMKEVERLSARQKLTETEKEFSGELISRGFSGRQVGEVRAVGDRALFGGSLAYHHS